MSISGGCLCGRVRFVIDKAISPFEICHCNRCRKVSGSVGMPTITVLTEDFGFTSGEEFIRVYEAPLLYEPPAYVVPFCSNCGSPLPMLDEESAELEIPAGLLDDDPQVRPDKHIFVEFVPGWDTISDGLPQYTIRDLVRERTGQDLPDDFQLRTHHDK